jgi:hypothetical protein
MKRKNNDDDDDVYLQVIIKFLKGYSDMMPAASQEKVLNRLNLLGFYSWFIPPVVIIIGILPLIATTYPLQSTELGIAHLIGFAAACFTFGMIIHHCLSTLINELNVYIKSVKRK